jgi:hypothetical protein
MSLQLPTPYPPHPTHPPTRLTHSITPARLLLPLQAMEAPAFWQLFQRQVSVLCVSEVQQSLLGLSCLGSRAIMALLANLCRANSCRYLAPQQRLLLEPWEQVRCRLQAWYRARGAAAWGGRLVQSANRPGQQASRL